LLASCHVACIYRYIVMPVNHHRPYTRVYEYNARAQADAYRPTLAALDKRAAKDSHRPLEPKETEEALNLARAKLQEMEEKQEAQKVPLWRKHPYYVPVESERTSPHEGSVWPESRPHFHLVSSYDLMVGYLGLPLQARDALCPKK